MPLERFEVASGTPVFDWIVPPEWNLNEAYLVDPNGNRVLDAAENNLHLVGYSAPFRGKVSRQELNDRLHSLPELPDAVPYVTSYYNETWGFCLSQNQRNALPDGEYEVVIDTTLDPNGSMTLSEAVLPGETDREVLISTYTCHPSMANNELSGPLVAAFLYRRLAAQPQRRLTFRFAFLAETIGAIAYLAKRGNHFKERLVGGLVATCVGMDVPVLYKRSAAGNTVIDKAAEQILRERGDAHEISNFYPWGSDERQYCSPGFDLPVGCMLRGRFFDRPEYHTSLDNRDLISFETLSETVDVFEEICLALDRNMTYRNTVAHCEPQLGRHGLYPSLGAQRTVERERQDLMWLLSQANGERDLLQIAKRSGSKVVDLHNAATKCLEVGLLEVCG